MSTETTFKPCPECGRIIPSDMLRCSQCAGSAERVPSEPTTGEGATVCLDTGVMGRRVLAALIDLVPLTLLFLGIAERWGELGQRSDGTFGFSIYNMALFAFLASVFGFYWIQEAVASTTLGKWLLGLRVVNLNGIPIGPGAAAGRTALRAIDGLPILYLVGFISAMVDDRRRRLGDKAAKCVVAAFRWVDFPLAVVDAPGEDFEGVHRSSVGPDPPSAGAVGFIAVIFVAAAVVGAMMLTNAGWAAASPPDTTDWRAYDRAEVRMLYPRDWFADTELPVPLKGQATPIALFGSPPARGGDRFMENLVVFTDIMPEGGIAGLIDEELASLGASDLEIHGRGPVTVGGYEGQEVDYSGTYATELGSVRLRQRVWVVSPSPPRAVVFVYSGEAEYNHYLRYAEAMVGSATFP